MSRRCPPALPLALVLCVGAPPFLAAQSAPTSAPAVMAGMARMEAQRLRLVQNYTLTVSLNGMKAPMYHDVIEIGPGGQRIARSVPAPVWNEQNPGAQRAGINRDMAAAVAGGYRMLADGFEAGPPSEDPSAAVYMNPGMAALLRDMATVYEIGAKADPGDGTAEAIDREAGAAWFAGKARLVGTEPIEGRQAYRLEARGLAFPLPEQPGDGSTWILQDATMWVDVEHFVQRQIVLAIEVVRDKERSPVTISLLLTDYTNYGPLHLAREHQMRIEGIRAALETDPKKKKEMEKNQKELEKSLRQIEELKQKIAAMPPAQQGMMRGVVERSEAQLKNYQQDIATAEFRFFLYEANQGPPHGWVPGDAACMPQMSRGPDGQPAFACARPQGER